MRPLNRSVAGVRGIWGENLFPETASKLAAAFGAYLKQGKVIVGRDTRKTGELLTQSCITGLVAAGCEVTDIGIVPTPTCQLAVEKNVVDGGIVITASHNPGEWNGLKFLNREGHFLNQAEYEAFIDIHDNDRIEYISAPKWSSVYQGAEYNQEAIDLHINALLHLVDVNRIKAQAFKVVLDAVNGAGSRLLIPLMERLGCTVITLYCEENGEFMRGAEPMPENLYTLCEKVKENRAHIGFAVDPDADRLSMVTDEGKPLGEEMTLPLVAKHLLSANPEGVIVTNLSTSQRIDHVAKELGIEVVRTKIGEAHVVDGMKSHPCRVGGEGNGGVIVPAVHYARDTAVGIAFMLESMAESGKTISELAATIPQYDIVKKKIEAPVEQIQGIYDEFKSIYQNEKVDLTDGIKIVWENTWLHIRKSGTEGLLRIFAEAPTLQQAQNMTDKAITQIQDMIK